MYFTIEDYKKIERWLKENSVKDTEFPETSELYPNEYLTIIQQGINKKVKLNSLLEFILNSTDSDLDITSTNPVQNQAVTKAIYKLQNREIIKIVDTLPPIDVAESSVIYILLAEVGEANNIFTEWIKVNNTWEKVGEFKADIDLSPYLTKTEAHTTYQLQEKGKGLSSNDYTNEEKKTLESLKQYTIESEEIAPTIPTPEFPYVTKGELTELSTEVSGLSEKVENIEHPIFKAIYGETTHEEVKAAYESGKVVHCDYLNNCYVLSSLSSEFAFFSVISANNSTRIYVRANNTWSKDNYTFEIIANKVKTISESSTDTQYPSAKAVYDAVEAVKEKDFELLLDTTFEEDVESFNASAVAPRLLECKDFIVLLELQYDENRASRSGYIHFKNGSLLPSARIDSVVTASYLTHYILRIHLGQGVDKTASIESHTNAWSNPQYGTLKGNIMCISISNNSWDKFDFQFGFFANEKIRIYGK